VAFRRTMSLLGLATLMLTTRAGPAELPAQVKKTDPEAVKKCDIGGVPGVLAADGVCVKLSGYISTKFEAGRLNPEYNRGPAK